MRLAVPWGLIMNRSKYIETHFKGLEMLRKGKAE
jgi:hypothetical protein